MSLLAKLKLGACVLSDHPGLVGWYLRNKLRVATLGFERNHLEGVSRFARGITFRLTNGCNLRCKMCRFVENDDVLADPRKSIPLEAWMSVADDLARLKPYITLTGGEPLMFPQVGELILHIKKRGMRCTVTTNGTMLARRAQVFMDDPPDLIVVSLDAPPALHNEIRGQPRVFERAAEGIAAVKAAKDERNLKDPILAINCAVTAYNYRHAEQMVDIARDLGVDAINFQHQWSLTRRMVDEHNEAHAGFHTVSYEGLGGADPEPVDLDEMVGLVSRIRKRASKLQDGVIITFHPELDDEEVRLWYADPHNWVQRRPAVCAWMNTEVLPNGDIEPCYGFVCGNVTETKLTKLWNSLPYREYRRRLSAAGDYPICVRCCAFFRRD